jgi:hypothetical protein
MFMISAVGEGAQVALQATTIGPAPQVVAAAKVDDKAAQKSTEATGGGGKGRGDTVAISTEAKQLSSVALNSAEESQESPQEKSNEESAGKK